ncbi:hypothetical protein JXA32_15880 [Candidatus Sumerlaeota bacterium]|nr:hypothetical protein [Candidatus Sumerlaeota bacterium]
MDEQQPNKPQEQKPDLSASDIFSQRWILALLIFFVLGALTIPLINQSKVMGRVEKRIWQAIALAYTAAVLILAAWLLHWQWLQFKEALELLEY